MPDVMYYSKRFVAHAGALQPIAATSCGHSEYEAPRIDRPRLMTTDLTLCLTHT
ncbi:Hypothetical protein, putative [Bodo saltans]|uniref:Uncharacterized protein n=1 Tax=Bodo saltans TaxID=75058 RepID=A0A0S4IRW0_BODSA|nr:Hypothetical protein, putative [Bodo saltans]|eukprot:CUF45817.1 Hypothetical protein, putative [Bodo saltans]